MIALHTTIGIETPYLEDWFDLEEMYIAHLQTHEKLYIYKYSTTNSNLVNLLRLPDQY